MVKNKYQILQEWHELLKAGTISEEDFEEKGYLTPSQFSIAGDQLTNGI